MAIPFSTATGNHTTTLFHPKEPLQQSRFSSHNFTPSPPFSSRRKSLSIRSIDVAQPYDLEPKVETGPTQPSKKLKIAVIGFGKFGQFLSRAFIRHGHTVLAHSRSDYQNQAQSMGARFFPDLHDLCERHPDVIIIATSIISMEEVLRMIPLQRLRRNTLFVDVLSVKEFPKNVFLQVLPLHFDVLCTHPMFGPDSGKHSWNGLSFMYEKVRIGDEKSRIERVENFLEIFEKEGCKMKEMLCSEHDKQVACSQFVTHTIGRILEKLQLESTLINTKGYEALLNLVENTVNDSFDLYFGLFMYNKNSIELLERLDLAFVALKKELFGRLHEVMRKQLFGKSEEGGEADCA